MNRNINNILEEKIKILNLKRKEIYFKLLKSILHNNNTSLHIKNYSKLNIIKLNDYNSSISKKNKICLYSGKRKSIMNGFNFSRYKIKNLITSNKLNNFKKNNW
jgi:ribosomal protein S14